MSVSGQYCAKFADASHVCFEGHLRAMAIQCILSITDKTVTLSKSGTLKILPRGAGKQKDLQSVKPLSSLSRPVVNPWECWQRRMSEP